MKAINQNQHIIESSSSILNMLCVIDLSLILFNSFEEYIQSQKNEGTQPYAC